VPCSSFYSRYWFLTAAKGLCSRERDRKAVSMENRIHFWTWVNVIGIGGFYLLVLIVIPLGARDLVSLFRTLKRGSNNDDAAEN